MAHKPDYEVAASVYPDPRTLFDKDEWYFEPWYRPYKPMFSGAFFGIAIRCAHNWNHDRPLRAGLHIHALLAVGFAVAFKAANMIQEEYWSFRDRVYKDYVNTHPDDFPPPPKRKIAEVWEPWVPAR